jgi:TonB family protein
MIRGRETLCLAPLLLALLGATPSGPVDAGLIDLVRAGRTEAVRELLSETTRDLDAADESGWTALMYAVRDGHDAIVETLLEAGADPDQRNPSGETPLHLAARYRQKTAARLLLEAGADHTLQDADGRTPLYRAIETRGVDIIEMLQGAELARGQGVLSRAPLESQGEALPPRIVESTPAPYTATARAEGVEGGVVLMVLVRRDGTVGAASVSRGLEPSLDESALRTVKEWKFAPAMRDGRTVEVVLEVEVEFRLPHEP